ncbi:MAG: integrase core domain-containing protein [Anaerolineae bacterium]|nr:integrase core domain-containing protein [Anaerolineae bacterium]
MRTWTQLELAWELDRAGVKVPVIAQRVGKHRATVYRWLKGMRRGGLREFVREYKNAKKRPRRRKVNPGIERRVLSIRREHRDCCGEKIVYWLDKEGVLLSRSTVYRVLNKHLRLRPKGHRNRPRGPVPRAKAPREVIQMDTVDFGGLYAYSAIDTYTREVQVVLLPGLTGEDGRKALDLVMAYFGSCQVLQTDGGKEFKGEFQQRVGCYAQRHRVARPYRQNEQAFVESFHRTLRKECLGWWKYKVSEKDALQEEVQRYLDYYHYQRPHLGLGMQPPLPPPCRI